MIGGKTALEAAGGEDRLIARLLRFGGVGAVATLTHVVVAILAAELGVGATFANFLGFCAAFTLSYLGHFHMTFRLGGNKDARHPVHILRFLVVSLLGLGLSSGLVLWLTVNQGFPFVITMGVVAIVVASANFVLSSLWAFRPSSHVDQAKAEPRGTGVQGSVIAGLVTALFLALLIGHPINHDTAWYLVATQIWLDGGTLYVDVVEINPPLAFYLTASAIVVSDVTGLSPTNAFYVVLAAVLFGVTHWIWAILGDLEDLHPVQRAALAAGLGLALWLPALNEIGQREHLMTLLAAPWLVAWLVYPGGGTGRAAVVRAMVAAVGICLKPYFVLIPIALVLVHILQTRSLRPIVQASNLSIAGVGIAYIAFVALIHPAYFENIVPIAFSVYDAYAWSFARKIQNAQPLIVLAFFSLTLLACRGAGRALPVLAALVAAALASYTLQNKGFTYHALPIVAFASMGAAWLLIAPGATRAVKVLSIAVLTLVVQDTARDGRYVNVTRDAFMPHIEALLEEIGSGHSMTVLSTDLGLAFPLVLELETRWASRYPALWLVPGAVGGLEQTDCEAEPATCETLRGVLQHSLTTTVEDIAVGEPDLIFVVPGHIFDRSLDVDHLGMLMETEGGPEALAPYRQVEELYGVQVHRRQNAEP